LILYYTFTAKKAGIVTFFWF